MRKLRSLRGQADNNNPANKTNININNNLNNNNNASLTNDLESIRRLFNEKEKELAMAVTKESQSSMVFMWLKQPSLRF